MTFRINPLFFTLLVNLLAITAPAQTPWPVFPQNVQPNITGTVGEFRGSTSVPRFHRGTDITNGADYRVFAIEAGMVTNVGGSGCNKYVEIQNARGTILYYHIDAIVFSGNVTAGQQIGSMTTTSGCAVHLHIQRIDQNFLENAFSPFVDHTAPTIFAWSARENGHSLTRSATRYSQNSLIDGVSHRVIGNKVDLVLNAEDTRLDPLGMSPGVGAVAPFSLAYQILDPAGNSIGDTLVDNINFSQTPLNSHAGQVFGTSSNSSNYNWIMTSHPSIAPADRYWNTGIRQGTQEDWANTTSLDAALNLEAQYPEGPYLIRFSARDVDFMSDSLPGSYNEETLDAPVVIDNFRPYVKKVVFQQDTALHDSADWLWDGNTLSLKTDSIFVEKQADLHLRIHCSEPMKQLTLEIPEIGFQQTKTTAEAFSNDQIWAFQIDSTDLIGSSACKHTLRISGLDYADHPLETDPSQLSVRQSASQWSPAPRPGVDQLHSFQLAENCVVGLDNEMAAFELKIYPNPAKEVLWIKLSSAGSGTYTLRIWSPLCQLLLEKAIHPSHPLQLSLADWAEGIYFVQIETENGTISRQLQLVKK